MEGSLTSAVNYTYTYSTVCSYCSLRYNCYVGQSVSAVRADRERDHSDEIALTVFISGRRRRLRAWP